MSTYYMDFEDRVSFVSNLLSNFTKITLQQVSDSVLCQSRIAGPIRRDVTE